MISLGIDQFIADPPADVVGERLALLCNQSSVNGKYQHSRDRIQALMPGSLTCLISPQHGFFSEKQDNMIESDHDKDGMGIPVFSLYGDTRVPTKEMYDHFDVLLVDLLDVGTRVYTFMSTLAYCLEAAAKYNKKVIVLDRPNPVGGSQVEGNILADDCRSFVGLYALPMRHGFTFGELALFINDQLSQKADLQVLPMRGWQRDMYYPQTGLPWVYPSPYLPTFLSALVYPGQVLWEGTNISEGRGTTLPFELFGSPSLDHNNVLKGLDAESLKGCVLRPVCFEPTSNKWAGQVCKGFHLHVTDASIFKPYRVSLALLKALSECCGDFALKEPPYEYEFERLPLDLILGDTKLFRQIQQGAEIVELERLWQPRLDEFIELRPNYFLYK
nr:DUF1343 domain-containing protein [Desulfobulbaceae bacterium]